MKLSKSFSFVSVILAVCVALLAGCNDHRTDKISDIVNNPSHFMNKDVTVAGEVTKVYELPLGIADMAAYRVTDGTGQIWVLTHAGAPREGDKVGLKGDVRQDTNLKVLGSSLLTVINEHERKVQ